MVARLSVVLFLSFSLLITLGQSSALLADDSMMASFGIDMNAKRESLFPQPQEKQLAGMREAPDQVVWVFRESLIQSQAAADGDGMASHLAKAMKGMRSEVCWLYTKSLIRAFQQGDDKPLNKLAEYLTKTSLPEDSAAFLPVLTRLPEDLQARVRGGHEISQNQVDRLDDEELRRDYVARITNDKDFYRKKRFWMKAYAKVKKGIDGLVDRITARFCEENLIRCCARLSRLSLPQKVKDSITNLQSRLGENLHNEMVQDFEDRMEGNLIEKTQSIESMGGHIMVGTVFFGGRVRRFSKRIQKYSLSDLKHFLPHLAQIHRHIRRMARGGHWNEDVKTYLTKADKILDNMSTTFKIKLHFSKKTEKDSTENQSLFSRILKALSEEDNEGVLAGLPRSL